MKIFIIIGFSAIAYFTQPQEFPSKPSSGFAFPIVD